ncbi:MAG TPA: hypothetical protein VFG15_13130 [Amycolatopsis sp.]|nr:hypothetical protein [Amycolatopsis sp.]
MTCFAVGLAVRMTHSPSVPLTADPAGHLATTATDVARRGEDGLWRYVLDNPFGVGVP